MKFSILINTHNQKQFLNKAIYSCVNQKFKDYEIIIVDTSDKKNFKVPRRKNIKYFFKKNKFIQAELNQMYKVKYGFQKSKGKYIILMDGDDKFSSKKLKFLNKLTEKKKIFFNQDIPNLYFQNSKTIKSLKIKNYKKNYLFEYFINNWPQIYGTSSILIKSNLLSSFFKKAKPFKWPLLAIDIQLLIFCKIFYDVTNYGNSLTLKRIHGRNLGDKYLKLFSRKFWIRRNMQFKYNSFLRKKNIVNIDCLFTNLICKIIK